MPRKADYHHGYNAGADLRFEDYDDEPLVPGQLIPRLADAIEGQCRRYGRHITEVSSAA